MEKVFCCSTIVFWKDVLSLREVLISKIKALEMLKIPFPVIRLYASIGDIEHLRDSLESPMMRRAKKRLEMNLFLSDGKMRKDAAAKVV